MSKLALVVMLDRFADWEAGHLLPMLNTPPTEGDEPAWKSAVVSLTKEPIKSMGLLTVTPDLSISEVPESFDALILIGGMSWRKEEALEVVPLIEKARQNKVPLAAICDAANFLAWHGFLNDVAHTGNAGGDMSSHPGSTYDNKEGFDDTARALTDGGIITADGASPFDFAAHVLRALEVLPSEVIDEWEDVQLVGEKAFYRE